MSKLQHIALLTSGGDAPGMNAAIRAVVRTAHFHGIQTTGVLDGYDGLVKKNFLPLGPRDVSNIVQRGGTILRSARSEAFMKPEGRAQAAANLREAGIDALIVIGGGGSQSGAHTLSAEQNVRVMGIASTIDNDLGGSDRTIGFDTACNTALEAIDRLRDTASSYGRIFFVEVMGRDTGFIAMHTGIAAGAEYVMVPERKENVAELTKALLDRSTDKSSSIVVVAEGDQEGGACFRFVVGRPGQSLRGQSRTRSVGPSCGKTRYEGHRAISGRKRRCFLLFGMRARGHQGRNGHSGPFWPRRTRRRLKGFRGRIRWHPSLS